MRLSELINETISDMKTFGLTQYDLDEDGYVTLYHGTTNPKTILKKDEIFFMTPNYNEALDYTKMRQKQYNKKGVVQEIKVKPNDVYWNQGSYEVEFDKGGKIVNGYLIPSKTKPKTKPKNKNIEYKGIKIGTILPKTNFKVLDIIIHDNGKAQFQFKQDDGDTVINYEYGDQ